MFITAATLDAVQACCAKSLELTMIAYGDLGNGYGLIYGVCGDPDMDRWTPFTMRDGRVDLRMWPSLAEEDPGLAAMATFKLVDGFMTGAVPDPHVGEGE